MTPLAIAMMVVAITIIWGGLVAAILFLRRHPAPHGGEDEIDQVGGEFDAGDVTRDTGSAPAPGRD